MLNLPCVVPIYIYKNISVILGGTPIHPMIILFMSHNNITICAGSVSVISGDDTVSYFHGILDIYKSQTISLAIYDGLIISGFIYQLSSSPI